MNARTAAYWTTTALTSFAFLSGGAIDLAHGDEMVKGMAQLGYPAYFLTILGAWKVLGALAIAAPRTPRLKEWAYAGIAFDLTGAALSHAASGDATGKVIVPLVLLAIASASWALRPRTRVLGEIRTSAGLALRPAPGMSLSPKDASEGPRRARGERRVRTFS